ncbi:MAG: hypothetical protein AB7Q17_11310 [Phycisphaerae bacterium]
MNSHIPRSITVLFTALAIATFGGTHAVGQTSTCTPDTSVTVCVEWSQPTAPVHNQDFRVSFTSATAPTVELLTGDAGWVVYATLNSTGDPANIASISTPAADNFVVQSGRAGRSARGRACG